MIKQKKSKGFTLVELLAVIIIVGILSTVGIVAVTRLINKAKEEETIAQEKMILIAAKSYYQDHRNELPLTGAKSEPVNSLIDKLKGKYLTNDIKAVDADKCVIIKKQGEGKYIYKIDLCS